MSAGTGRGVPDMAIESGSGRAVGVDVGGTKTGGVLIDATGRVLQRVRRPTVYGEWPHLVAEIVEVTAILRTPDVLAVGISLPGIVDAATGDLVFSPRPPLQRAPITSAVASTLQLPVLAENDANAAAWAERCVGAGRGYDNLLLVAMGTGLGGAVITDGRLLRGANGFAAEIWRLTIDHGAGYGSLGDLASGTAIARLGRDAAQRYPTSLIATIAGDPSKVRGETVTQAARQGDESAIGILGAVGAALGSGLAHLIDIFDPTVIVVGGGPSEAGELLLGPARASMHAHPWIPTGRPEVPLIAAALGNEAGAIGAALLALDAEKGLQSGRGGP